MSGGADGLRLEVHDLAISKFVAGRDKDLQFTRELARHRLADPDTLRTRLADTQVSGAIRKLLKRLHELARELFAAALPGSRAVLAQVH